RLDRLIIEPLGGVALTQSPYFRGVEMSASKLAAVVVTSLVVAACAGSPDGMGPGPKENTGTLVGAGTGALLGAAVAGGGTGNRLAGAAIRGGGGGLGAHRIGSRPRGGG